MRRPIVTIAALLVSLVAGTLGGVPAGAAEPGPPSWGAPLCGTLRRVPIAVALDLSDDGVVVGHDRRPRAVSWDRRTDTLRWYGGIHEGRPSQLTAVSPGGRVAGEASVRGRYGSVGKAVRIEGPLPLVPVNRDPTRRDWVYDVNDANTVVGISERQDPPFGWEPFVWTDRRHVLPPPGPDGAFLGLEAIAVNGEGWVLGSGRGPDSESADGVRRTVLWSPERVPTALPALGGRDSFVPVAIDGSRRVAGYLTAWDGDREAVGTWTAADGFTFFPAPGAPSPWRHLEVRDAAPDGTVLGILRDNGPGGVVRSFLHHPGTGYRPLALAGSGEPLRGEPVAVNARHDVLVTVDGAPHVWKPCPCTEYPGEMLSSPLRN